MKLLSRFEPTSEQRTILAHDPSRHARVLAGPGTGKSATLVALADQLLSQDEPTRLRLLTFTRAATGELAKKVSEHPAAAAERPSTIHSFAISVLARNPGASMLPEPLRIADDWEYETLVRPSLARRAGVGVRRLDVLVREMAANWESLRPEENPAVKAEERARFFAAWTEHRDIYGYTLLQELPFALRMALRDHSDLEGVDYDLLIVDEYQDLNACDLDVIKLISKRGCSVIGAGDDDQSIYSFRKAAPEGIRRFMSDYRGAADYTLSITQRCGSNILDWAGSVIAGDLERLPRDPLTPAPGSPTGDVALLSFEDQAAEAHGIATMVKSLIDAEQVEPDEILILLRGDHNHAFSDLIKPELKKVSVRTSDPDAIDELLAEPSNRQMLASVRLLAHREDSLAWATLLQLQVGVGEALVGYVYDRARIARTQFAQELMAAMDEGFPDAPTASANRAGARIKEVLAWLGARALPVGRGMGWGKWIVDTVGDAIVPSPSRELRELLLALDQLTEPDCSLGRYLGQITPLGKDRERSESDAVRVMTMSAAKGLTVRATIIAALEDGIMPRPDVDVAEERRLLYVAMTRARKFLYGTWARRRTGPTARAGAPRVLARRHHSPFLSVGPVESQDGRAYMGKRWPQPET